jgi:hypothetical protein
MDWLNIIQTIGFPIACVCACAWFIYYFVKRWMDESSSREAKLMEANIRNSEALSQVANTIVESNEVNKELSETNKMLVDKIENTLSTINHNVEKILDNLSNVGQ